MQVAVETIKWKVDFHQCFIEFSLRDKFIKKRNEKKNLNTCTESTKKKPSKAFNIINLMLVHNNHSSLAIRRGLMKDCNILPVLKLTCRGKQTFTCTTKDNFFLHQMA